MFSWDKVVEHQTFQECCILFKGPCKDEIEDSKIIGT